MTVLPEVKMPYTKVMVQTEKKRLFSCEAKTCTIFI